MTVMICAYIGGLTGIVKRKGRGVLTVLGTSMIAGLAFGLFVVVALLGLSRLRVLIFDTITANATGLARFNESAARFTDWLGIPPFTWLGDGLAATADPIRDVVEWGLRYWPLLVCGYAVGSIMVTSLIGWWVLSRVLEQLRGIPDVHKLETPDPGPPARCRCSCATSGSVTRAPSTTRWPRSASTSTSASTSRSPAPTVRARPP